MTEHTNVPVRKIGHTAFISEEEMAMRHGFHRRGHAEHVTPTKEQIAQHARAVSVMAEVEANPYIRLGGYDYEFDVIPLTTERWVYDETSEEWMARWREHRAQGPGGEPKGTSLAEILFESLRRSPLYHQEEK